MSSHGRFWFITSVMALIPACQGERPQTDESQVDIDTTDGRVDATVWHDVDEGVETDGLNVRFQTEGDEVGIWTTGKSPPGSIGTTEDITLTAEFVDYRISEGRYAFELRARGSRNLIGAPLEISIRRGSDGSFGGEIEAEEPAALGGWIEVEYARLVPSGGE